MSCRWIQNNNGEIIGALTQTGERSKLFDQLNEQFGKEKAVELFAVSESDEFQEIFGGNKKETEKVKQEFISDIVSFQESLKSVENIAKEYKKEKKLKGLSHPIVKSLYEEVSKEIVKEYENDTFTKNNPKVKESYNALIKETVNQYNFIVSKGLKVEKYDGVGEPYEDSKEMLKDLRYNKTLKFLPNEEAFGDGGEAYKDSIGLQPSGIFLEDGYQLTNSEVFRVVHDYFGHGILGNQFGAIGEENATLQHLDLYSDEAKPAVVYQTRGQNSWVNFSGKNKEVFPMFSQARKLKKEGKVEESKKLLEKARKMFTFAEPKDLIFKNKYNFKKYETARRIKEQIEIDKSPNQYGSNEISKLLPIISKNNVVERGISRSGSKGDRQIQSHVLKNTKEITLNSQTQSLIKKAFPQITSFPKIIEIFDGNVYRQLQQENLKGVSMSSSVTVHSADDYNKMRMFVTEDGYTGITLTKDGFLGGAFSSGKSGRKADLAQLMVIGIKEGATNAESFNTFLPDYYSNFGFKAVSKTGFNEEFAPENWNYNEYENFQDGKPDVVHFIYDGGDRNTIEERLGQFDLYSNYQESEVKEFDKYSYEDSLKYMQNEVVKRFEYEQSKKIGKEPTVENLLRYIAEENKTTEKLTKEQLVDLQDFSNFDIQKLFDAFYDNNGLFIVNENKLIKSGLYSSYEAGMIAMDMQLQQTIKDSLERLKNTSEEELNLVETDSSREMISEFNSFGKLVTIEGVNQNNEGVKQAEVFVDVNGEIRPKRNTETELILPITAKQTENQKVSDLNSISLEVLQNNQEEARQVLDEIENELIEDSIDVIGLSEKAIDENLKDFLAVLDKFIKDPTKENTKDFADKVDEYFQRDLSPKKENIDGENNKEYVKLETNLSEEEVYNQQGLIKLDDNTYIKTAKEDLTTLYENVRTYTEKYSGTLEEHVQEQLKDYSYTNAETAEAIILYKMYFGVDNIKIEKGVDVGTEIDNNTLPTIEGTYKILEDEESRQGGSWLDTEYGENRFETEEEAMNYVKEVHTFFKDIEQDYIPIYRAVSTDENVSLDPYEIGESWSVSLDSAKEFGKRQGTQKTQIISGYVWKGNVDWESAIRLYHSFSDMFSAESEFELPIPSNNQIKNVTITSVKNAKELGKYKPENIILAKQVSNFTGNYNYLKEEFPSDFYSKFLAEKKKNSKLFRNFYSNFEINEKGINLINKSETALRNIKIYADENLKQYSLISKQMPDLIDQTDNISNPRVEAVNNPQKIKENKENLYKLNDQEVIIKNETEDFVKVNGEIYESVAKQGNLNHFVKINLENTNSNYYAVEVKAPQTNLKLSDYNYLNESPEKFKTIKDLYKPKKQEIVKDKNYMLAPNGKPTNLSEENWIKVRTPEFKEFFGDWQNDPENSSKVVDENGVFNCLCYWFSFNSFFYGNRFYFR